MEAELRAQRELSQIEEQEEDLRVKRERLELEKQLKKVQREKSIAQTSLEIERSKVEEAADDADDDEDMSLEASEDDSQDLSESEDEHEVTEDEEKLQVSVQPRKKRIYSPRYALPVKQPAAEQQENAVMDPFAKFSQSIADAIMKVAQGNEGQPRESGDVKMLVGRQLGRDLPTFSGEAKSWTTFIAAYERTNRIGRYSDEENLQRLDKALKDKAKDAVQALMVSPKNVDQILKTLKRRFGQPSQIIECIMEEVRSLQIKEDDPESIVEFSSKVEGFVATTEHLNKPQYLENPVLLKELVAKLPFHMALRWGDHVFAIEDEDRHVNIKDFSRWFGRLADSINMADMLKKKPTEKTEKKNDKKGKKESVYATKVVNKNPKVKKCAMCDKTEHEISKCQQYLDASVDERFELTKKKRLCFCCLKYGHSLNDCKGKKKCGVENCERSHHPTLHKREVSSKPQPVVAENSEERIQIHMARVKENPRVPILWTKRQDGNICATGRRSNCKFD